MLNMQRMHGKIQDNLQEALACIFAKQFNGAKFFPLLVQFTDDPDLKQPANLIFSIYNLLIREQSETAFNGLSNIQKSNPNSVGNIASLVVRSTYQAYKKRYRESLDCLNQAVQLSEQATLDRQFCSFYSEVIARMIQIFDFGAFRRQYMSLIEHILNKYPNQWENNQILKNLVQQKDHLKDKICIAKPKQIIGQFSTSGNSVRHSKYTIKLKNSRQASGQKSQRQKSLSSSKKSNLYSPRSKHNFKDFKAKKYVNPYGLMNNNQSQVNKCVFM